VHVRGWAICRRCCSAFAFERHKAVRLLGKISSIAAHGCTSCTGELVLCMPASVFVF
jgi:hypothetical protein